MITLLDVNVLLAHAWPEHSAHRQVREWFPRGAARGFATCPLTQAGFVRILSNPGFSRHALSPARALELLRLFTVHPSHHYWSEMPSLEAAVQPFARQLQGHRQVTDAYLLGLTIHHRARLATLDAGLHALAQSVPGAASRVVLLSA